MHFYPDVQQKWRPKERSSKRHDRKAMKECNNISESIINILEKEFGSAA